jgi:hypothetical protein
MMAEVRMRKQNQSDNATAPPKPEVISGEYHFVI